jgi:hypothetical protein
MTDLPEPDYGDVWDSYQRGREYELGEHEAAKLERAFDCHPDPKPAPRVKRGEARMDWPPRAEWKWRVLVTGVDATGARET